MSSVILGFRMQIAGPSWAAGTYAGAPSRLKMLAPS